MEDNLYQGKYCQAEKTLSVVQTPLPKNGIWQPLLSDGFLPPPLPSRSPMTSAAEKPWSLGPEAGTNSILLVIIVAVFGGSLFHCWV